jgi:hypothetical protein
MNKILGTIILLGLASCTQLNSLEITPDDNAMAVSKAILLQALVYLGEIYQVLPLNFLPQLIRLTGQQQIGKN